MADARLSADLAAAAGVRSKVTSVAEGGGATLPMAEKAAAMDAGTPVEAGTQQVRGERDRDLRVGRRARRETRQTGTVLAPRARRRRGRRRAAPPRGSLTTYSWHRSRCGERASRPSPRSARGRRGDAAAPRASTAGASSSCARSNTSADTLWAQRAPSAATTISTSVSVSTAERTVRCEPAPRLQREVSHGTRESCSVCPHGTVRRPSVPSMNSCRTMRPRRASSHADPRRPDGVHCQHDAERPMSQPRRRRARAEPRER
jgi:hypothetical protein